MKARVLLSTLLLSLAAMGVRAADAPDKDVAVKAAAAWLQSIDAGNYADSWSAAAPPFQQAVTASQWAAQLRLVRLPLGQLLSRSLAAAKYYTELPGAPDGQYWVIQEQASFENKKSAVETVTMMHVGNTWMPAGYYIR
ncbi:MAG TPA: DUF4019 domain-containing protein [Gammaproteobacteria bacterium]|nr:DUF4019 domain-containing protein [Gammaproteobacteria bacterium]